MVRSALIAGGASGTHLSDADGEQNRTQFVETAVGLDSEDATEEDCERYLNRQRRDEVGAA